METVVQKNRIERSDQTSTILVAVFVILIVILFAVVILIIVLCTCSKRWSRFLGGTTIVVNPDEKLKLEKKYRSRKELRHPTIFVAISSYRDPELVPTIKDLFDKSLFPDRIRVGIVEQNDTKDSPECHARNAGIDPQKIKIHSMHYKQAKGPTYARSICEKLWDGEDYFLMTDSHMRFELGWDVELIEMLLKTRRPMRTVISMYPEGFERRKKSDGTIEYIIPLRRGWRYEQLNRFNEQGIVEFESVTTYQAPPKVPQPVPMMGACFVFAHSDLLKIVPFHPDTPYLFFGEEMFMTVRMLSHGYDLVGPTHSVLYHNWTRNYRKTFWEHDKIVLRDLSIAKIKKIMKGEEKDSKYGMGDVRSWEEIQDYLGIHFDSKKFTRPHKPWTVPHNFRVLQDEWVGKKPPLRLIKGIQEDELVQEDVHWIPSEMQQEVYIR